MAGVKLKIAQDEADKKVALVAKEVQFKCGKKFEVKSLHLKAANLNVMGKKKEQLVKFAGGICSQALKALGKLCTDKYYRPEILKLSQIECIPHEKVGLKDLLTARLEGKKLILEHSAVRSPHYRLERIKKAFD